MACKQITIEEYQDLIRRNPQAVGYAEGQCDCSVICFKYQYGNANSGAIGDCGGGQCPPDYTDCVDCGQEPARSQNWNCSKQPDGRGLDRTNGTYKAFPDWYCQGNPCQGCCDDPPAYWVEEDSFLTITVAGACAECG
jgi:hypothetical protein